jgi:hypothetical protein
MAGLIWQPATDRSSVTAEVAMTKPAQLASILSVLALAACAQPVIQKEDMLAAAGFSFRPANTPQKVAALRALPPHRFVHQVRNGQNVWIYADPSICACLYAGNDTAYQQYRQEVFQKRIADEQAQAARLNQDAAMEQEATMVDWSVWGPWAPFYGP